MNGFWAQLSEKTDDLALRERVLIFAAIVIAVLAVMKFALLDPLSSKQVGLSAQMLQQQQQMIELQAKTQMQSMSQTMHNKDVELLQSRLAQLQQQLQEQDDYLQSRQDRLVEPNMMPGLLKQVLDSNNQLQLVELKTLPVGLLIENPGEDQNAGNTPVDSAEQKSATGKEQSVVQKRIFKHGVQITVRGGYMDMLRYVTALEKLPMKMFWGAASLNVEKYPNGELTLTLYTLSLDKIWLTV